MPQDPDLLIPDYSKFRRPAQRAHDGMMVLDGQQVDMSALRTLRLWHWRQAMQHRELARNVASTDTSVAFDESANKHLSFVQALNDLFPTGDNAEYDAHVCDEKAAARFRS